MAFAAVGIALPVLAAGCAAWWKYELRRSLPKVSGELRVAGLSDVVDVRRDVHGVPHVDAKTLLDAVRAQGVLHVQDRLWQMELASRVGAGRLCEVFGAVALPADRLLRRIGLRRAAVREWEHLDPTVPRRGAGPSPAVHDAGGQPHHVECESGAPPRARLGHEASSARAKDPRDLGEHGRPVLDHAE